MSNLPAAEFVSRDHFNTSVGLQIIPAPNTNRNSLHLSEKASGTTHHSLCNIQNQLIIVLFTWSILVWTVYLTKFKVLSLVRTSFQKFNERDKFSICTVAWLQKTDFIRNKRSSRPKIIMQSYVTLWKNTYSTLELSVIPFRGIR